LTESRSSVDPYIFAWGNPLVSHPDALRPTATAFKEWADSQNLRLIWSCVDGDLEHVLSEPPFEWSIVTCIYEDVVDPAHVMHLTSPEAVGKTGASVVKDLKKNLKRAERGYVEVREVHSQEWEENDKKAVEEGVQNWIKSRSGIQIASVGVLQPIKQTLSFSLRMHTVRQLYNHGWTPVTAVTGSPEVMEKFVPLQPRYSNRLYNSPQIIGINILTPIHGNAWQIKNAISFPDAPRGTSEALIYTALKDLHHEEEKQVNGHHHEQEPVTVTFGISAADEMEPVVNLSGWKVTALATLYGKIAYAAGLLRRGEFRVHFLSSSFF
jgi:hypothetical protein